MKRFVYILLVIHFFSIQIFSQGAQESLKRQALTHMSAGRYGEAIDLLNKYISANAQIAEGYNLRGLCHEKRSIYQFAVLDFRRAVRLDPGNPEFKKNLDRALRDWHQLLYKQIEGYKREIAIDPAYAFNYLEVGKCYRWLEEWAIAEQWYDEYLARDDDAVPDEIIRYTEILSHTGSIVKGEKILKKYVERYPDDWRLWSRYGYFTMWLGNYKNAENAFLNALSFKPFFKEAVDGLDLARNQGYMVQQTPRSFEREYPIDRYYRLIKNNPEDDGTRFMLVEELITAERYEEAHDNLKILRENYEGTERFDQLWEKLTNIRETMYTAEIEKYLTILKQNPDDRESIKELSKYLAWLEKYDEADEILREYLQLNPDDTEILMIRAKYLSWNKNFALAAEVLKEVVEKDPFNKEAVVHLAEYYASDFEYDNAINVINNFLDRYGISEHPDVRFALSKYYAWNYDWEDARDVLDDLLVRYPGNLDYQLQRAQISVWTVDDSEFPMALQYFENVLKSNEKNLYALLGLITIKSWEGNLDEAKVYLDLAQLYYPNNPDVRTTENFYNSQLFVADLRKYSKLREEAGELVKLGDCEGALAKYNEYFLHIEDPDRLAYREYASVNICIGNYDTAIGIYDRLLEEGYEFEVALDRAKAYLWSQDTVKAINEFEELAEEDPDNFEVRLFLGDSYRLSQNYRYAEGLYRELLYNTEDTSEISMINDRIRLIPPYGFNKSFNSLVNFVMPYSISIIPSATFYKDNQDLFFYNFGGRIEMGLMRYFSIGVGFTRTNLESSSYDQYLTSLTGSLFIHPVKNFSIGGTYGKLNIQWERHKYVGSIAARYDEKDKFNITLVYEDDDARRVLYSPYLLYTRLDTYSYILSAFYNYNNSIHLKINYRYNRVSDGNEGNDLRIALGKILLPNAIFGYEYFFTDYANITTLYYSPQGFDTHSIWGEWTFDKKSNLQLIIGGKIGYAPSVDYVIGELFGEAKYELVNRLFANVKLAYGNSFRFDSSYRSISALISLYWSFF